MTRAASSRRPRATPGRLATSGRLPTPGGISVSLEPTRVETDPDEVERFVAERDADLGAERMLLIREACIVAAIVACLVLLQVAAVRG